MTILDDIFRAKRLRVEAIKNTTDLDKFACDALASRENVERHRFKRSVGRAARANIIAEFKRASPSKGLIDGDKDPATVALVYEKAGAAAMSVLTEEDFFQGSLDDLTKARAAATFPILRKDFTFDEFQIYEAALAGADAILLIVASLSLGELRHLMHVAKDRLAIDALVEVHTAEEMKIAADIGATLIGVNNRDLKTFEVSLDVSRRLVAWAPAGAVLVAESGIRTREDIEELSGLGYRGFLIGETLMRSSDVEAEVRELLGNDL